MVKQHSFDCSTIRFTSQRNCSFFFWKTSIRCRRPMQVKFFLQSFPGSILVTVPQAVEQNFEHTIFLRLPVRNRKQTDSSFLQGIRHILCSDMTTRHFSYTHTHTHSKDHSPGSTHTHIHNSVISFTHLLFFVINRETKSFFSFS